MANGQQPSHEVELESVLCVESEFCSPTEGDLRSSNQEAGESHPTVSTWTTSGYNPWSSKLRSKVLTLRRQPLRRST